MKLAKSELKKYVRKAFVKLRLSTYLAETLVESLWRDPLPNTDEKVKYDADDTAAGYLADKIVAGTNVTIEEGTGADENKVKISAADNNIDVYLDFLDTTAFVYNCPAAMKFTQLIYEGYEPALSVALNTDMAQFDKLTVTPDGIGLVILKGVLL